MYRNYHNYDPLFVKYRNTIFHATKPEKLIKFAFESDNQLFINFFIDQVFVCENVQSRHITMFINYLLKYGNLQQITICHGKVPHNIFTCFPPKYVIQNKCPAVQDLALQNGLHFRFSYEIAAKYGNLDLMKKYHKMENAIEPTFVAFAMAAKKK
jgi:hypothetical protein